MSLNIVPSLYHLQHLPSFPTGVLAISEPLSQGPPYQKDNCVGLQAFPLLGCGIVSKVIFLLWLLIAFLVLWSWLWFILGQCSSKLRYFNRCMRMRKNKDGGHRLTPLLGGVWALSSPGLGAKVASNTKYGEHLCFSSTGYKRGPERSCRLFLLGASEA
jgi:hypothetical protein